MITIVGISKQISKIKKIIAKNLDDQSHQLAEEVKQRTLGGLDATGVPFRRYSERYAKIKKTYIPNLRLTGQMLDNIKVQKAVIEEDGVELTLKINNEFARKKARWNQGENPRIPVRRFFALDRNQIDKLKNILK